MYGQLKLVNYLCILQFLLRSLWIYFLVVLSVSYFIYSIFFIINVSYYIEYVMELYAMYMNKLFRIKLCINRFFCLKLSYFDILILKVLQLSFENLKLTGTRRRCNLTFFIFLFFFKIYRIQFITLLFEHQSISGFKGHQYYY